MSDRFPLDPQNNGLDPCMSGSWAISGIDLRHAMCIPPFESMTS